MSTITGLSAGTYTATVTNTTTGCTNTCQVVVTNATTNPSCSITANSQPSCANLTGGSITVVPSPAGTYTYNWQDIGLGGVTRTGLSGGNYTVTVTNSSTGCTGVCNITLTTPTNCCDISTLLTQVDCKNAGTFPVGDDFISFQLLATAFGGGPTYTITVSQGTITPTSGVYGQTSTFALNPGSVGAGDVIVTLTDINSGTCQEQIVITDPLVCDLSDLCLIDGAGLTNIICNDNGTSGSKADDYTIFSLNPTGMGIGTTYSVTILNGGGTVSPGTAVYGAVTNFQFNPGSATGGQRQIRIQDLSKPDCYFDVLIPSPGPCSNCVIPPCTPIQVIKN